MFLQPVEVGNLLQLDSCVLFTSANAGPHEAIVAKQANSSTMHVEVVAYVTKPESRESRVSNTFYFSFSVEGQLPRIIPNNLSDAQKMIQRMTAEAAQAASH